LLIKTVARLQCEVEKDGIIQETDVEQQIFAVSIFGRIRIIKCGTFDSGHTRIFPRGSA